MEFNKFNNSWIVDNYNCFNYNIIIVVYNLFIFLFKHIYIMINIIIIKKEMKGKGHELFSAVMQLPLLTFGE